MDFDDLEKSLKEYTKFYDRLKDLTSNLDEQNNLFDHLNDFKKNGDNKKLTRKIKNSMISIKNRNKKINVKNIRLFYDTISDRIYPIYLETRWINNDNELTEVVTSAIEPFSNSVLYNYVSNKSLYYVDGEYYSNLEFASKYGFFQMVLDEENKPLDLNLPEEISLLELYEFYNEINKEKISSYKTL